VSGKLKLKALYRIDELIRSMELGNWYLSDKSTPAEIKEHSNRGQTRAAENSKKQGDIAHWIEALIEEEKKGGAA
jgi:hypothetical protein